MITDRDIARWRLRSQHLTEPRLPGAADVVESLLAVQAENPSQSAWAVAARTASPGAADLAHLLDEGRVIRTHVLRPTWHYVTVDDLVWLLELTAPRVRGTFEQQLATTPGLTAPERERACELILAALGAQQLTRAQLAGTVADAGLAVSGHDLMLLLADLELQALVCSGAPVDGVHSYALLADRLPSPRRLEREEALAELVVRYFTGHGPATERDLAYWATLTVTDVRAGLASVADRLEAFEHDDLTFWHAPGQQPPAAPGNPAGHLLQVLDETYRGYAPASRWVLDAAGVVPRSREAAIGMALHDGQLVASMRRTVTGRQVVFELRPYESWTPDAAAAVELAASAYGDFLGREAELRVR